MRTQSSGYSLIELMTGMAIGAIVIVLVTQAIVFMTGQAATHSEKQKLATFKLLVLKLLGSSSMANINQVFQPAGPANPLGSPIVLPSICGVVQPTPNPSASKGSIKASSSEPSEWSINPILTDGNFFDKVAIRLRWLSAAAVGSA